MTLFPARSCTHGRRAFWSVAAVCVLLLAALLSACAGKGNEKTPEWDLSAESQVTYYYLLLNTSALKGDMATVRVAFEKLLALDPDVSIYREAAEFYLDSRLWAEARNTARQGLIRYPDELALILVLTESYLQEHRVGDATEALEGYVRTHPNAVDAAQELARLYLINKRYQDVLTVIEQIPARQRPPVARHLHARALIGQNRTKEAEQELRRLVREEPEFIEAWIDLAVVLQSSGQYSEAALQYEKALQRMPDSISLWLRLIDTHLKAKRPDLALRSLSKAPATPLLQLEAAAAFLDEKQYNGAAMILNKLKERPGAPEELYFYQAAIALEARKDPQEAIRLLGEVSFQSRLAERALRWRLQLMLEQQQPKEALAAALAAVSALPENKIYRIIAAQVAAEDDNFDQARLILRDALRIWHDDPVLLYHMASMTDAAGAKEEAMRLMERLLELDPDNTQALNYVGYTLAEQGRELPRAYELISKAVAGAPDDLHILDSLAWVQYQMGAYQDAWGNILRSVELGADHPVIWEHYGDIALKLGKTAEARKGYTRALNMSPDHPEQLRDKLKALP